MPYIKQDRRKELDEAIFNLSLHLRINDWKSGDLNYCIFRLMKNLFEGRPGYQTVNDFRGALGCCWDEFYRRVVAPYENSKIKENGDVDCGQIPVLTCCGGIDRHEAWCNEAPGN